MPVAVEVEVNVKEIVVVRSDVIYGYLEACLSSLTDRANRMNLKKIKE